MNEETEADMDKMYAIEKELPHEDGAMRVTTNEKEEYKFPNIKMDYTPKEIL